MKVSIITEGGEGIGWGHIMRCLALYQAFEEKDIVPKMFVQGDQDVCSLLVDQNVEILSWTNEYDYLNERIEGSDIAIVDSYLAEDHFYHKLPSMVKIAAYVDDYKRIDYSQGIVINGTINVDDLNYPQKEGLDYLVGKDYVFLREEFWNVPDRKVNQNLNSILITFGANDFKDMTVKVMKFLKQNFSALNKKVVIGKSFKQIKEIEQRADDQTDLLYYPDGNQMRDVMSETDLAISAGGQTLNELARMGLPAIGVCVADNQENNLNSWQRCGFLEHIGWYDQDDVLQKLIQAIEKLSSYDERIKRSRIGQEMVDGQGVHRICDYVLEKVGCVH